MVVYSKALLDDIEHEKKGEYYVYNDHDRKILDVLFTEINEFANTDFHYLAELDTFDVKGSGHIISKYIDKFNSVGVKAYLMPQLVSDKVPGCSETILKLYLEFKESSSYISRPGYPAPAYIYVRYDNMFRKLKPKKLKEQLTELVSNPRDAYYLPFTTEMLASWKILKLKDLSFRYFYGEDITVTKLGLPPNHSTSLKIIDEIKRQLKFTAIDCLGYFAEQEVLDFLYEHVDDPDKDIQLSIKNNIKKIEKKLAKM